MGWWTTEDYKEFLRTRRRQTYKELKKEGKLEEFAEKQVERAEEFYQDLVEKLMQRPENQDNRYQVEAEAREFTNAMLYGAE